MEAVYIVTTWATHEGYAVLLVTTDRAQAIQAARDHTSAHPGWDGTDVYLVPVGLVMRDLTDAPEVDWRA